jgi:hypothetical protein
VCTFGDVQIGGYADAFFPDNYIAACATKGITQGSSPGRFSPGLSISRAQVVTMCVRGAGSTFPGLLGEPYASWKATLPNFDPTHDEMMRKAEYNALTTGLVGFGVKWNPWAPASRGEVAQILWNLKLIE